MPLVRKESDKSKQVAPLPSLSAGLGDSSAEVRWAAARSALGRPDEIPPLADALTKESETRVREAIFTALARIATPESARVVVVHIRSDEAGLRTAALDSLRAMPDAARPHLPTLLSDPDNDVRLLACDLARDMPDTGTVQLLCDLIEKDPQPNVCAAAVEVLADIGGKDAVESLARCAARFSDDPFLVFAIAAATERLNQL